MTPVPKRRRIVLWGSLAAAAVAAAVVGAAASAHPSDEQVSNSALDGRTAPAISGPNLSGQGRVSLAQFRHKWVLVNFMASWCTTCQQEMPQLELFQRQHAKAGDATILTVEYDAADTAHLRTYLAHHGAGWPAVNDPTADVPYGVAGLPSSFLVAPGGTVYASVLGEVKADELDGLLRQGARAGLGRA
jgi:thiol:disulfide interchange protein